MARRLGGDPPESVTAEEMLAGANRAAVIRADGTAEIIHFQDVTATEAYEVEILDGPGGAVLRTETGITTSSFGVRRSGSTDTITSADLSLRKDGVNA